MPGRCFDIPSWYLSSGVYDAVLDVAVLILPVPMVWKLQMKQGRKLLVLGLFVCGYW